MKIKNLFLRRSKQSEVKQIKFPKQLSDEIKDFYKFRQRYFELEKVINPHNIPINFDIDTINKIIWKLRLQGDGKTPEIEKLINLRRDYLNFYDELRKTFLKYNKEFPDDAKLNDPSFAVDKALILLQIWVNICRDKLLEFFEIKEIEKGQNWWWFANHKSKLFDLFNKENTEIRERMLEWDRNHLFKDLRWK